MAKKRLNKKMVIWLVIIGVVMLGVVGVFGYRYKFRDPQPFLIKARVLVQQADQAETKNIEQCRAVADPEEAWNKLTELNADSADKLRKEAVGNYESAFRYARRNRELANTAAMELAELYWKMKQYNFSLGVYNQLFEADAANLVAKRKITDFYYQFCLHGGNQWAELSQNVNILITNAEKAYGKAPDLDPTCDGRLQDVDYLMKAFAMIDSIRKGTDKDIENSLVTITDCLDRASRINPKNPLLFHLRAQLELAKAVRATDPAVTAQLRNQAEQFYRQGTAANPDNPLAFQYYFEGTLFFNILNAYTAYRGDKERAAHDVRQPGKVGEIPETQIAQSRKSFQDAVSHGIDELEPMIAHFPNDGLFLIYKADLMKMQDTFDFNKVIDLYNRALSLATIEPAWYFKLADLYRARAEIDETPADYLQSYTLLKKALYLPELKDVKGAKAVEVLQQRYELNMALIDVCAWFCLNEPDSQLKQKYIENARLAAQELKDLAGPESIPGKVAAATLALAEGRNDQAIRYFYEADQQIAADGRPTLPRLKKHMFLLLRDSGNYPAAVKYGLESIQAVRWSQGYLIKIIETLQQLPGRQSQQAVLQLVQQFQSTYPQAQIPQRVLTLQAAALIRLGQFDDARAILDKISGDDDIIQVLRAQAKPSPQERIDALEKFNASHPADPAVIENLFQYYMSKGRENPALYDRARALLAAALQSQPDNVNFQRMAEIARESNPAAIPGDRIKAIMLDVAQNIKDPYQREIALGEHFYNCVDKSNYGRWSQADLDYFRQAREHYAQACQLQPNKIEPLSRLLSPVFYLQDWSEASKIIDKANAIDPAGAISFDADLKVSRGDAEHLAGRPDQAKQLWLEAASLFQKFLAERPLHLSGRIALARVYLKLGDWDKALEQAQTAVAIDNSDLPSILMLANIMHTQNLQTGIENLPPDRVSRMVGLIARAIDINPTDYTILQLQIAYYPRWIPILVESGKSAAVTDSQRQALMQTCEQIFNATVQSCRLLIAMNPTDARSWQALAELHSRYADVQTTDAARKDMIGRAEKVYLEAIQAQPQSTALAASYSSFLQRIGRTQESEKLLLDLVEKNSGDQKIEARFRLAGFYYHQQDFDKARQVIDEILKESPDNPQATTLLAEDDVRRGNYDQAIQAYARLSESGDNLPKIGRYVELLLGRNQLAPAEKILAVIQQKHPDELLTLLIAAQIELFKNNYAAAVAYVDKVLVRDATNVPAHLIKAKSLYLDRQYQPAMDCLTDLRNQVSPESDLGRLLLSDVYWDMGRYNEAINELQAGLHTSPKDLSMRKRLVQRLKFRSRWNELDQLFDETAKIFPDDASLFLSAAAFQMDRGKKYFEQKKMAEAGREYQKALAWADRGWQIAMKSGQNKNELLDAYLQILLILQNPAKALSLLDQVGQPLASEAIFLARRAEALAQSKKNDQALAAYEQALIKAAGNSMQLDVVVNIVSRLGSTDNMIGWAKTRLAAQPDSFGFHRLLTQLYMIKKDYPAAIAEISAAREKASPEQARNIDLQLGVIYEITGQKDQAILCYRRILQAQPDNALILNNLAYNLMSQGGNDDEAVTLAQKAYQFKNSDSDILDTYALALMKKNDFSQAEAILRQAVRLKHQNDAPVPPEYDYHLAQALHGQQRDTLAQNVLQQALQRLSDDPDQAANEKLTADVKKLLDNLSVK